MAGGDLKSKHFAFVCVIALMLVAGIWRLVGGPDDARQDGVPKAESAAVTLVDDRLEVQQPGGLAERAEAMPESVRPEGFLPVQAPPALPADGLSRRVGGWVVDGSGEPIVDAVVFVEARGMRLGQVLSDEDGRFRFDGVPNDALRLTADGEDIGWTSVRVAEGADVDDAQLTLEASALIVAHVDGALRAELGDAPVVILTFSRFLTESRFGTETEADTEHVEIMHEFEPEGGGEGAGHDDTGADDFGDPPSDGHDEDIAASRDGSEFEVARGKPGERVRVMAGVELDVAFGTHHCGSVRPEPGEVAHIHCTNTKKPASIRGRVVDTRGGGIAGIGVELNMFESVEMEVFAATSGPDGSFELNLEAIHAEMFVLSVMGSQSGYATTQIRNVNVRPGSTTNVGNILMMRRSEVPIGWMTESFGGIGGLVTLDERGVLLVDIEPDCPLAVAGVDTDDVITRIDGLDAGRMPMDEILLRLRGEVGSVVAISVRNPFGETLDLQVTRGVIRPAGESWPELDHNIEDP